MTRYLLDTDTLSWLMRDPAGAVALRLAAAGEDAVATAPIVAGELRFGAQWSGSEALVARVDELLARLQVLRLDERVASTYADLRWSAPARPSDRTICGSWRTRPRAL